MRLVLRDRQKTRFPGVQTFSKETTFFPFYHHAIHPYPGEENWTPTRGIFHRRRVIFSGANEVLLPSTCGFSPPELMEKQLELVRTVFEGITGCLQPPRLQTSAPQCKTAALLQRPVGRGAPMPFFRIFHFQSQFCSVTTPCGLRSLALVAATEETLHMSLKRKVARKLRLMNSPVFGVLAWVLALFVPHRKGFGKFSQQGEVGSQAGEQLSTTDAKEAFKFSKAFDSAQDLPGQEQERPQNVDSEESQANTSPSPAEFPALAPFISGGVWAIESIEQTPELMLDNWQYFELQLPGLPGKTRHLAGSNARHWHGQVSSAIVAMDPATRRFTTSSGRVYELGERNGLAGNGEYTWHQWLRINQATDIVDVTDEIKKMLAGPA